MDGVGLGAVEVKVEGQKAYGDVQEFARDLVAVDEGAPFSVYRDQA